MDADEVFARIALLRRTTADWLESLSHDQWASPSLCAGWSVHVVAAHLVMGFTVSMPRFGFAIVRNGFSVDKAMDRVSRSEAARLERREIVALMRANAEHRFTPPGSPAQAPLTDCCVHQRDMAIPLGSDVTAPVDDWVVALDFVHTKGKGMFDGLRVDGVRLVATDADWSAGDGAEVRGTVEALTLAAAGRTVALDDLTGDGVTLLRSR